MLKNIILGIILISIGYLLTMLFIGHLFLTSGINGGLYPKVEKILDTKCIENKCINIYVTDSKIKYLTIYYYNKNNSLIKYRLSKKPDIYWTKGWGLEREKENINKIKNILRVNGPHKSRV